jgi:hypothetical protein
MSHRTIGAVVEFFSSISIQSRSLLDNQGWRRQPSGAQWKHFTITPRKVHELADELITADPGTNYRIRQSPDNTGSCWTTRYTRTIGRVDGYADANRLDRFSPSDPIEMLQTFEQI